MGSPAVSGQASILLHDAMAGNCQRYGIAGACPGYGTHGLLVTHFFGDLTIAARFSIWDFAQGFPNAALEGRSLHIEREVQANIAALQILLNFGCDLFEAAIIACDI